MFEQVNIINTGETASVYEHYDSMRQINLVAKVYQSNDLKTSDIARREIRLLEQFQHPGIIKYEGYEMNQTWKIFLEKCEMDLFDYLEKYGSLPINFLRDKFLTIFQAVAYLHSKGFAHSDIKPENIGITAKCELKLIDFGSCLSVSEDENNLPMSYTPLYASPQRIFGSGDAFQNDIWSLGVTLFVAATGSLPFEGEGVEYEEHVLHKKPNFQFISQSKDSNELVSLLQGMLEKNPEKRFTIDECLEHQFFDSEIFFD